MKISGDTKVVAIFGDPISHTLSPAMQNAAFKALSLNYVYIPFRVAPADLKEAVNGLRALNFKGANITVPHKETVRQYLDYNITVEASFIGAVNTIENVDGKLKGDNTDYKGFITALKEAGVDNFKKLKVIIVGAGGAAKAACVGLEKEGVEKLVVTNRTIERAELMKKGWGILTSQTLVGEDWVTNEETLQMWDATTITPCPLEPSALKKEFIDCDLLVNTTSVGMKDDTLNLPLESLKKSALVYDMIYNPPKTRLLQEAEKLGLRTENGLNMLLYQGAAAFEIWTKEKAPIEVMREALLKAAYK